MKNILITRMKCAHKFFKW